MKYDVVIPVSYKDVAILKKNIRYIRHNLIGTETIYVLLNAGLFVRFRNEFLHKYQVTLIDENSMLEGLDFVSVKESLKDINLSHQTGWYFQQFLKMSFALSQYVKKHYLVWDSDTIPVNKISFFDKEGKVCINPKKEHHEPYFYMINSLFKEDLRFAPYSFISEHMMFSTSIMKELLESVASRSSLPLNQWWNAVTRNCKPNINQNFSEFETYGTYIYNKYPQCFTLRKLNTFRLGGMLFGRLVTDEELSMLSIDFDTVSFERGHTPKGLRGLATKCMKVLIELKHKMQ